MIGGFVRLPTNIASVDWKGRRENHRSMSTNSMLPSMRVPPLGRKSSARAESKAAQSKWPRTKITIPQKHSAASETVVSS
jgi:hypothetical protein